MPLKESPALLAAWGMAVLSLALVALSFAPVTPLAARDGFAEAVASLQADVPDLVVVWPPEQASALSALPVELNASDAVPLERAPGRRFLRIAVLAPAGAPPPRELEGAVRAEPRRFADVEVGRFSYAQHERVTVDLRRDWGRAGVRLRGPEGDLACDAPRSGGGWSCPGRPAWNHVAPAMLTVDGAAFPCVWAHPVAGRELLIDLGPTTLASRVDLRAALSDEAAATPGGAAVTVLLEIEGVESRSLTVAGRGMARLSVSTPRGTVAPIRLVISAPQDGRRHLGVDLRVVEAP